MADKAATIYIVDVGQSMGEKNNGREQTDLEFALQYVFDKITTTISNGRKTDMIGTIAMRTDSRLLSCDLMGLRGTLSDVVGRYWTLSSSTEFTNPRMASLEFSGLHRTL
jgi:hypothetical protein